MIFKEKKWLIVLIFASSFWIGCKEGPKEFLKTAEKELTLAKQAEGVSYPEALDHYQEALEQIEKILDEYPSSRLSNKISPGKKLIGPYTYPKLKDEVLPRVKMRAKAETDLLSFALLMANLLSN